MSRLFWAEHRVTGERWQPSNPNYDKEYLVMYDSGYLAVVLDDGWTTFIKPLDNKVWKIPQHSYPFLQWTHIRQQALLHIPLLQPKFQGAKASYCFSSH